MNEKLFITLITVPNDEAAQQIAATLVEERLAACVNIVPKIRSIFRWAGKIEDAQELLLIVKTTAPRYKALEERVKSIHPYENPEIVAIEASAAAEAYLRWAMDETAPS